MKKETDTETEKLIYYAFRRFGNCRKYVISLSLTVNSILWSLPSNNLKGLSADINTSILTKKLPKRPFINLHNIVGLLLLEHSN